MRDAADLDPLLDHVGDAHYVLLGEASHGTAEFYTWRAALSWRLILEKGFSFIAVEGDWPDCYRLNQFVQNRTTSGGSAREVLRAFERWPTWMWANEEVVRLAEWLRQHNKGRPEHRRVGFYGLDVYSLGDSLRGVADYLQQHRPSAEAAARRAFECFEPYGSSAEEYARVTRWVDASCEDEVVALLTEVRRTVSLPGMEREASFDAEQNAHVVKDTEHYYRTMVRGGPAAWNIRDHHMTETLDRLMQHHGTKARGLVWAHNTHIGDARFTDMVEGGMVNLGQLVRTQHGREDVVLVGFGSYQGSVIAGREWEAPLQRMPLPPARRGSWEDVCHQAFAQDTLLLLTRLEATPVLNQRRGHRAVGVVYHPEAEIGNYVPTVLPRRDDAFLYLDTTQALHPLHDVSARSEADVPETYPSGV